MNTYTELEVITYNAILDVCDTELGASIVDMNVMTSKSPQVLRGVIASLVKKDMITVVHDEDNMVLFAPYNAGNGECYTWGGESITDEESALFVKLIA